MDMPRCRTRKRKVHVDAIQAETKNVHVERSRDRYDELERRELNQRIEPRASRKIQRAESEEILGVRAKLHRIRGDRKIPVATDSCVRFVDDVHFDALWRREWQWRRIELRMKATDGDDKVRIAAPRHQQAHLAFQRDEQNMRIVEGSEEVEAALVELKGASKIYLQQ